jgi:hypothetical protein
VNGFLNTTEDPKIEEVLGEKTKRGKNNMKRSSFRFSILGSLAAALALASFGTGSASASTITFAQYFQFGGPVNQWTISTVGTTSTITGASPAGDPELFAFMVPTALGAPVQTQFATFSFSATSSTVGNCATNCSAGDPFTQSGYTGSFSFTEVGGPDPGANLLTGNFTNIGTLSADIGGTGATFLASDPSQITMTSAYLAITAPDDASFSLSGLNPAFFITPSGTDQGYPDAPIIGAGDGTFSDTSGVPEPATFAMIGGGLLGLGLLSRKKLART